MEHAPTRFALVHSRLSLPNACVGKKHTMIAMITIHDSLVSMMESYGKFTLQLEHVGKAAKTRTPLQDWPASFSVSCSLQMRVKPVKLQDSRIMLHVTPCWSCGENITNIRRPWICECQTCASTNLEYLGVGESGILGISWNFKLPLCQVSLVLSQECLRL